MQRHELTAWLGDTALTDDQIDRLGREADRIAARWPETPEEPLGDVADREAALTAACQYLLGETTLEQVAAELFRARLVESRASAAAQQVAAMAVDDGMPQTEAARRAGIDRMTVRAMLGL